MRNYLYRGVSQEFYERTQGKLTPKETKEFKRAPEWDRAEWDNIYWPDCEENAVIEHQLHQAGYPTSGISTTPLIERAKYYATHGGKLETGLIYVIDQELCKQHNVKIYVVPEVVPIPSIPEDKEVVLVANDFGTLPMEIIVDVQKFNA